VRPLDNLKLSAGARLDYYSNSGSSLNPRVALITGPYPGGNLKLMFGKAFIAPSLIEAGYAYPDQVPNPNVAAENLYSAEVELSHRYVTDVISLEPLPPDRGELPQYQNTRTPIGTLGVEAELRREWKEGWMVAGSYSFQRSAYLRSRRLIDLLTLERSADYRHVPNSPTHLASLRAAAPLLSRALQVMSKLSLEGGRHDRNSLVADASLQTRTRAALLWDFVFSGTEERLGLDYSLGVYNLLDSKAEHPVSNEFRQLSIPITGRSILAAANVSF
jgi:outer membrane receptor protein involved in Fe transport